MESSELLIEITNIIERLNPEIKLDAFHYKIINECCECAIKNNPKSDKDTLINSAQIASTICLNIIKEINDSIIKNYGKDSEINFEYKGKKYKLK